jgi:CO/xanthine dehydrogenase Mo-binding subunit
MKYAVKPLPPVELPPLRQVGKPLRRVDALGKAVGHTVYAGDYVMLGMLHAKVFRSSQASARITRLDVDRARALPGVVCILTAADLPDAKLTTDMPGQTGQKRRAGTDAPVLASDRGLRSPGSAETGRACGLRAGQRRRSLEDPQG